MTRVQDCHALTTYYVKGFEHRHNRQPVINRNTARWGFDSILQDMSVPQIMELVDYYFTTPSERDHNLDWFFYNYEKLSIAMYNTKEDKARNDKLMEESRQRAEKWRQSGKRGITSTQLSNKE